LAENDVAGVNMWETC